MHFHRVSTCCNSTVAWIPRDMATWDGSMDLRIRHKVHVRAGAAHTVAQFQRPGTQLFDLTATASLPPAVQRRAAIGPRSCVGLCLLLGHDFLSGPDSDFFVCDNFCPC